MYCFKDSIRVSSSLAPLLGFMSGLESGFALKKGLHLFYIKKCRLLLMSFVVLNDMRHFTFRQATAFI